MNKLLRHLPALLPLVFLTLFAPARAGAADAADLEEVYATRERKLQIDDAQGFFDLGYFFYSHHAKSLDGLAMAEKAFVQAAGHFDITLKDSSTLRYNVSKSTAADWLKITAAYGPEITAEYAKYILHKTKKSKDKVTATKPVEELTAKEQLSALHGVAKMGSAPIVHVVPTAYSMHSVTVEKSASLAKKLNPDFTKMIFAVIGGLGIFLIGMKSMSEGIQAIAGARLRRMISLVTNNRFSAIGIGAGVTCLVQSSSITTVLVVGFVNSGLMLLHQAVGVIMGANIGTTITGWILVLKIGKYGLPILGVSAFVYLMAKRERVRFFAMAVMGLGMVFFGLEMMKNGFKPMSGVPQFEEFFHLFTADSYFGVLKCALVGCVLTFIVQSSSATLGITIGLASTGVIPFETAAALVLGENIGTTITAWLASIGATTNAKRAAYFHVLFNIIGVLWVTAIFALYIKIVAAVMAGTFGQSPLGLVYAEFPDKLLYASVVTVSIAATHTIFNVTNTIIFIPFARFFATFLERVVPDKDVKEVGHLQRLDVRMVESPVIAIEQSRAEISKMGEGIVKMMDWTRDLINSETSDPEMVKKVFHREEVLDQVQVEITQFLAELMSGNVPQSVTHEARAQVRAADEYESVSDYISALLKASLTLENAKIKLDEDQLKGINALHDEVKSYVELIVKGYEQNQPEILTKALSQGDGITHHMKSLREAHLENMSEEKIDPSLTMSYIGMLNAYRKIKDHLVNVAEVVAGAK